MPYVAGALAIVAVFLLSACGGGGSDADASVDPGSDAAGVATTDTAPDTTVTTSLGPNLVYSQHPGIVVCDNVRREIGVLANADANEPIEFTAPDSPFELVGEAKADGSLPIFWQCAPAQANRTWRVAAVGMDSGRTGTFTVDGRLAPPARPGGIEVEVIENPFSCDGDERVVAELSNLTPNVELAFEIEPEVEPIIANEGDEDGNFTVYWSCTSADVPTSWLVVIHEATPEPRRRASFRVRASNEPYRRPAEFVAFEEPFVCDGEVREFAEVSTFIPGEFIRFSSPQTGNLRGGNADDDGNLRIRWQCDPDEAGKVWEVTADGGSSLATVTFTITGGSPETG